MCTSVMLFDDEMMKDPAEAASEPLPDSEDKEEEFDEDDDDEDEEDLPDEDEEE
jgi:hypothetical protein